MKYPMFLQPAYKDYLWGGNRLEERYGKKSGLTVTAESWELACHRDGKSTVTNGIYAGQELQSVCGVGEDFPVLVKLIDANKDLSIQVHPSDENADRAAGESGKSEMWYIVESKPGSYIYYGFKERITKEQFRKAAENGTICDYLNKVPVKKGDVFYIEAGTVHAIGAGMLIAEIQQSSNTTFRIYDYQRRDAKGNLRQLHLDRAEEVTNFTPVIPEECRANCKAMFDGFTLSEMYSCRYFQAYRIDIRKEMTLDCPANRFHHLLVTDGTGELVYQGTTYPIKGGDSCFIPKGLGKYVISGNCTILLTIA